MHWSLAQGHYPAVSHTHSDYNGQHGTRSHWWNNRLLLLFCLCRQPPWTKHTISLSTTTTTTTTTTTITTPRREEYKDIFYFENILVFGVYYQMVTLKDQTIFWHPFSQNGQLFAINCLLICHSRCAEQYDVERLYGPFLFYCHTVIRTLKSTTLYLGINQGRYG